MYLPFSSRVAVVKAEVRKLTMGHFDTCDTGVFLGARNNETLMFYLRYINMRFSTPSG